MAGKFVGQLDLWLKEQDTFSRSMGRFKDIVSSYFKGADQTPTELKNKLHTLEKNVNDIKQEFIGVLNVFYDLHVTAHAMLMDERRAKAHEDVTAVKEPDFSRPAATLDIRVPRTAAAPAEVTDAEPDTLPSIPPETMHADKGILGYINYVEWFYKQSPDDRKKIAAIFLSDPRFKTKDLLEREITFLPPKMASYLYQTANKLLAAAYDEIATALLIKGLTIVTDKADKEMIHIIYAKYFYRKRKELKDAYMGCISHCEKAVKSYLSDSNQRNKPIAPFKLLTKIYEEREDFKKIMDISAKAVKLYENSPSPDRAEGFRKIMEVLQSHGMV